VKDRGDVFVLASTDDQTSGSIHHHLKPSDDVGRHCYKTALQ
jgi:hypothetical protein